MLEIENKHSIVRDKVESFIIFIRMMVCKIEQISPPHFCKTCLAPQDDFGMQKNLVNKHKQVGLGQTPTPTPPPQFWNLSNTS